MLKKHSTNHRELKIMSNGKPFNKDKTQITMSSYQIKKMTEAPSSQSSNCTAKGHFKKPKTNHYYHVDSVSTHSLVVFLH